MNCKYCGKGPLVPMDRESGVAPYAKWKLDDSVKLQDPWEEVICPGYQAFRTHEPEDLTPQEIEDALESIMRREKP